MQMFFSSVFASSKALRTPSRSLGCSMANTRAELSWACTSLTKMPGGGFGFFVAGAGAWPSAPAGHAAASPAQCRKLRRFRASVSAPLLREGKARLGPGLGARRRALFALRLHFQRRGAAVAALE